MPMTEAKKDFYPSCDGLLYFYEQKRSIFQDLEHHHVSYPFTGNQNFWSIKKFATFLLSQKEQWISKIIF